MKLPPATTWPPNTVNALAGPPRGPLPAPLEPIGAQLNPLNPATMSAVGCPSAFWNEPATKTLEPERAIALMNAVAGSHPSLVAALPPKALHAVPFHLAT